MLRDYFFRNLLDVFRIVGVDVSRKFYSHDCAPFRIFVESDLSLVCIDKGLGQMQTDSHAGF